MWGKQVALGFLFMLQIWQPLVGAYSVVVWDVKTYSRLTYPELRPHVCDIQNEPCAKLNG